ncbi:TPA: hypothetical protein QC128_004293 [Bacillus cereus]|uniref:hypothetical protein n=1 Tax=Bacillus TaxID=1386 RepID=UPI0005E8565A|nr:MULTISPECIES: hypothetical protein [Bacillus]MBJ6718754.1 hypothetical protein [Bacillus sp. PR5]CGF83274.1 Uncharacterised protein [Streptococcus pneumoniae]ARV92265.1 hypothetical protein BJG91_06470 [Bacillus thuringiensis]MBR9686661.1 hypothetical protein [Bacillus cereus]MCB5901798.1 hypothetical protein [Bacillus cereus]
MWNIREEDMGLFKIENRNRLSPDYIRIFYGGVFAYTSIPMLIMFLGVLLNGDKISLTPLETFLVRSEVKLYILELIFLIIFMSSKVAFKLQKLQAIVTLFYSFQLATLPFIVMMVEGMFDFPSNNKTLVYIGLIMLGALCTHIVATIDVFRKAKHGGYKLEGPAVSFFTDTKLYFLIGITISVIVLLVLIFLNLNYTFDEMAIYVTQTIILYTFAVVSAEFVLLVYCRFKFPSFNITWEQHEKERQEFIANRKRIREKEQKRNKN